MAKTTLIQGMQPVSLNKTAGRQSASNIHFLSHCHMQGISSQQPRRRVKADTVTRAAAAGSELYLLQFQQA